MLLRRDTRYKEYCYENSVKWIEEVYANSCVVLVQPTRMHLNTFACYDNFMSTNEFGIPCYDSGITDAWLHLKSLLDNLFTNSNLFKIIQNIEQSFFQLRYYNFYIVNFGIAERLDALYF